MTRFRPCIDLHAGQVKQIVGGTLDSKTSSLQTNFVSPHPPAHFARLYRDNALTGAHVIMLGPGNQDAARESLAAWPHGLQVGGGINDSNAREWIEAGAEKVCLPSVLSLKSPLLLPPIPLDTLGERHAAPAEAVECTADGQIHFAAAQLLHPFQILQVPAPAGIRDWDAAPLRQLLDQPLVDAPLQPLVVGRVDEELGAVGL